MGPLSLTDIMKSVGPLGHKAILGSMALSVEQQIAIQVTTTGSPGVRLVVVSIWLVGSISRWSSGVFRSAGGEVFLWCQGNEYQ